MFDMSRIQDYIENFPIADYDGLNGIGFGEKSTSGKNVRAPSLIFSVKQKKDLADLPKDQLLPGEVVIGGESIPTDVIEEDIEWEFEGYCHTNESVIPVSEHKIKTRPLMGGISIGNRDHGIRSGQRKMGTLGAIVVDNEDGQLVGLSNNHVLCPEVYTTANEQITSYNYKDERIIQPAHEIGTDPTANVIGTVKRVMPLKGGEGKNYIDAGVFNISAESDLIGPTSTQQLNLSDTSIPDNILAIPSIPFATTQEIDNLFAGDIPTFKSSRSTGPVGSPGHISSCELRIEQVNYSGIRISGKKFFNLIQYRGVGIDPSKGGDSGGLICCRFGDPVQWKAVGLHFAGGRKKVNNVIVDYGIACRIDQIAALLNVRAYESHSSSDSWGASTPVYKVVEGYRSEQSIVIDGKTYWQVGRTDEPTST
jgi:hypothetical protein